MQEPADWRRRRYSSASLRVCPFRLLVCQSARLLVPPGAIVAAMKQTASGLVLGPVLLRGGAFILDWLWVAAVNLFLSELVEVTNVKDGRPQDAGSVAAIFAVAAVYHIGFLAWKSATPGKLSLNIYVAYADGSPIRPDTAILRFTTMLVGQLLFAIGLIVSIVLLFTDKDRRTIHDRVAGTMVLAGKAGSPLRIGSEPPPRI
jgi:uncharacterized RDD family membrane protein YckC